MARYGAAASPASLASPLSVGGYSQHSNYSTATSMAAMSMPRPGYQHMRVANSPQQQTSGLPQPQQMNGGGHQHQGHPAHSAHQGHAQHQGHGGQMQMPRQTSAARRPEKKDTKEVAWVHWRALKDFLASWIDKESPTARASAREKLTRLTRLQFLELSTDVYDELMRRLSVERGSADNAAPFLPVRDDFHPKRNQARQKLATLPKNRFKDLASDVFFELRRRYPEFEEEQAQPPHMNAQQQMQQHPQQQQLQQQPPPQQQPPQQQHQQQQQDNRGYEESPAQGHTPVMGYSVPMPQPYKHQPSGSSSSTPHQREPSGGGASLRQQTPQREREREGSSGGASSRPSHHRKGSSMGRSMVSSAGAGVGPGGMESLSNGDRQPVAPSLTAATNDVVVPNKSRLQEEEIEVPYARDSTLDLDPARVSTGPGPGPGPSGLREMRSESRSSDQGRTVTPSGENVTSPAATDEQYFDRMSFASTSARGKSGMGVTSPTGWEEQEKKLRTEYEMRIVTLERRLQATEKERDELKRQVTEGRERRKDLEDEVRGLKERATTHASSLRSVQHELDLSRDATEAARLKESQTAQQAQEEIQQWRERCEGLEDELRRLEDEKNDRATREASRAPAVDEGLISELQTEVRNLVDELNALSARNDELMAERERDAENTAALEAKVADYKRQYNAARTELRNLKATSTLFVSQPLSNDHLPASPDGNIADTHVSAFQQAIDGLLQAARSSHPSGVLPAMKAIVEAVTSIGEDVKAFEESPNLDVDASRLESLKHESTTCLSGLMNAARNHAMASGLSPVSLIDAAAGHLSLNVVELIKLLKIRRSGKTREILNTRMSISDMVRRGYNENGEEERQERPSPIQEERELRGTTPVSHTSPRANNLSAMPAGGYDYRINSFQSAASTAQRSDSFALEQTLQRKASSASAATSEYDAPRPGRDAPGRDTRADPYARAATTTPLAKISEPGTATDHSRGPSLTSPTSTSSPPQPSYRQHGYEPEQFQTYGHTSPPANTNANGNGASNSSSAVPPPAGEKEWGDLKPYLNTQSSALVNAIQNLLAAIRTGGQGPALNEHLSEVIAISTSIVAVSSNSLPPKLRSQGEPLLADLTGNTDRLSEAQQTAAHAGGFDKQLRQGIASASFGVAKALKALMKLGD